MFQFSLPFLLILLFSHAFTLSHCATTSEKRIINGSQVTEPSEYAVEVVSRYLTQYQTWGGGTLIAKNVVLTQAQLIAGFTETTVRFGSVTWGDLFAVEVAQGVSHPEFDPLTHENDIGLLLLAVSVDESES